MGGEGSHTYTLVGLCEESIAVLIALDYITPLGFPDGKSLEGTFGLTDKGRKVLGTLVKGWEEKAVVGQPILSDEEA